MGRDTGIILAIKDKNALFNENGVIFPERRITYNFGLEDNDYNSLSNHGFSFYELCYWRKMDSIADELDSIFNFNPLSDFSKEIPISKLDSVVNVILKQFVNPDEFRSSLWSINEVSDHLANEVISIGRLKTYLKENNVDNVLIFFYDSI